MKHGKRLKLWMKKLIGSDNWLYTKNTLDELLIVHKVSGKQRKYNKKLNVWSEVTS